MKEKNVSKKKPTRLSSSPEKVQANKSIPSSPLSSIKSSIKNRKDERVTVLKSYAELNVSSETEHPIQLSRLVDEKVMVDIIEHLSEVEVLPRNHAKRKSLEIKPTRKLKRTKSNESRIQVDRNLQAIEKVFDSLF